MTMPGTPGEGTVAEGAAPVVPAPGPAPGPTTWRDGLPDEIRTSPSLTKFQDVTSLAKSYTELESHMNAKGVLLPKEGASPAEIRAAMNQLGCPNDPAGLGDWELPEGLPVDKQFVDHMRNSGWQHGLNPDQWRGLGKALTQYQHQMLSGQQVQSTQAVQEARQALESEWGPATPQNLKLAVDAAAAIFGQEKTAALGLTVDGTAIGNNLSALRVFHKLGQAMEESGLLASMGATPKVLSATAALAKIEQLKGDREFQIKLMSANDPGHKVAYEEWTTLHTAAHGGTDGQRGAQGEGISVGDRMIS